jgi:hypothetical protein
MTYHKPEDNVVKDGVLMIPHSQQTDKHFSFVVNAKGHRVSVIDNYKELKNNTLPVLRNLANIVGLPSPSTMRKPELLKELSKRIHFI